jgi:hypothetical protein
MNASAEAQSLTETLLSTIRLQRHLAARIIISTQEPTISPALLDLSSVTIVHRFTSPEWLRSLKGHLAGAASNLLDEEPESKGETNGTGPVNRSFSIKSIFSQVVKLRVGEALLFSPSAIVGWDEDNASGGLGLERLGVGLLKIQIRQRVTTDGGMSIMAS